MFLNNLSIKFKLSIIIVFVIIGVGIITKLSLISQKDALIENLKINANNVVQMAKSESSRLIGLTQTGQITKQEAKLQFLETLKGFAHGGEYIFAYSGEGVQMANGKSTKSLGKNLYDLKDPEGFPVIRTLIEKAKAGDTTPTYYMWKKADTGVLAKKISYSIYIPDFDLMIGTGGYLDKIDVIYNVEFKNTLVRSFILLVALVLIVILIANSIVSPIKRIVKVINNMGRDNYDDDIDTTRGDELGSINKGLDGFRKGLLNSKALEEQQRIAEQEQIEKAHFIGEKTKEVSNTVFEIDEHITGISSSAAELSSTLEDIARKVDDTSEMTRLAEQEAENGTQIILNLNNITENIGDVVRLIQAIAEKTNLLALNASIEAARAGEEGRGFAVVAEEVKKLAQQTRESTDSIAEQIKEVQSGSTQSVQAIENVNSQISSINQFAQELVISISEQKEATNDISDRMEHASVGSKQVSEKIKDIVETV